MRPYFDAVLAETELVRTESLEELRSLVSEIRARRIDMEAVASRLSHVEKMLKEKE
jgi:hypothetical protein